MGGGCELVTNWISFVFPWKMFVLWRNGLTLNGSIRIDVTHQQDKDNYLFDNLVVWFIADRKQKQNVNKLWSISVPHITQNKLLMKKRGGVEIYWLTTFNRRKGRKWTKEEWPRSQFNVKNRDLKLMSNRTTPLGASRMLRMWGFFRQQPSTYKTRNILECKCKQTLLECLFLSHRLG